jgi:putative membrane protein
MTEPERRPPRPRAFRLDGEKVVSPDSLGSGAEAPRPFAAKVLESEEDIFASVAGDFPADPSDEEAATEKAQAKGLLGGWVFSVPGLFWSALSGLVSLALTLWVTELVEGLFARSALLGTLGLALAATLFIAALILLAREIRAILRQNRIARLHLALAAARAENDGQAARARLAELCDLYVSRPDMAQARARVKALSDEIIDGRDLIDLAERTLIAPLDALARREIAAAAKRVSLVVTVSPRAILDVIFVAAQAVVLMRRIAEIYGGRPGLFGFFKLARSVGAHLAITGGLAIGDSLLQQLVGHGLAAKLSARLGEGVLNGLLTARVGLSAMAVCRPTPYCAEKAPGVKDVAPFLFGDKGGKAAST